MTAKASKATTPTEAASKPATLKKAGAGKDETPYVPPPKLSKAGEWRRKNPNGILKIIDMRAVMK
jgi:hypothetical protein